MPCVVMMLINVMLAPGTCISRTSFRYKPDVITSSDILIVVTPTDVIQFAVKRSCIKKGYMKDDYVHLFVKRPVRRSPIINRGMNWKFPGISISSNTDDNMVAVQ